MSVSLEGRRVLVIGAAGGIGSAAATVFAKVGAAVTMAGRPGPKLDAAARELAAESAILDSLDADAPEAFFIDRAPFQHVVIAAASTKTGSVAGLPLVDARARPGTRANPREHHFPWSDRHPSARGYGGWRAPGDVRQGRRSASGPPADIASAILFVAGNSFTGSTIMVDGGGSIA